MFVIIEYKSEEYFTNIYVKGRDWLGKKGKRRKIGREQKLEGHVRLLGVPSNIVCESPSVEFRLIKCSTLFVAFVSLAAILSFDPFLLKSVLFVAAGSPKLRTLSRPRRVFPAFLFHPPLYQSWCVFPPDFLRFREFRTGFFFFWQQITFASIKFISHRFFSYISSSSSFGRYQFSSSIKDTISSYIFRFNNL